MITCIALGLYCISKICSSINTLYFSLNLITPNRNEISILETMAEFFDSIDILGNVDMPLSHENITNLDIKTLNKLLQKEGFTKEETSHIKETRRRAKMKEYSRKRRQKEMEEIEYLEYTKAELVEEFETIRKEIYLLKKQKKYFRSL